VMLVTPLRDGMNLVAKEYVACRSDLGGALVLSEFAGAAAELRWAHLTNPHDLEGVKDTIEAALNQTVEEGHDRMRALRRQVLTHDVYRWADNFLAALASNARSTVIPALAGPAGQSEAATAQSSSDAAGSVQSSGLNSTSVAPASR
ncbi:trehalose-6-phosphate synthase, partial [Mycobacterium sp. NPDC003449]